jgi:hypothetical protein
MTLPNKIENSYSGFYTFLTVCNPLIKFSLFVSIKNKQLPNIYSLQVFFANTLL